MPRTKEIPDRYMTCYWCDNWRHDPLDKDPLRGICAVYAMLNGLDNDMWTINDNPCDPDNGYEPRTEVWQMVAADEEDAMDYMRDAWMERDLL